MLRLVILFYVILCCRPTLQVILLVVRSYYSCSTYWTYSTEPFAARLLLSLFLLLLVLHPCWPILWTLHDIAQHSTSHDITAQHAVNMLSCQFEAFNTLFARIKLEVRFGVIRSHGVARLLLVGSIQLEWQRSYDCCLNGECIIAGYAVGVLFLFVFIWSFFGCKKRVELVLKRVLYILFCLLRVACQFHICGWLSWCMMLWF